MSNFNLSASRELYGCCVPSQTGNVAAGWLIQGGDDIHPLKQHRAEKAPEYS
jgi:hypothetical protein